MFQVNLATALIPILCSLLAADGGLEIKRQPPPKDEPAPGYRWVSEPRQPGAQVLAIGRQEGMGVVIMEEKKDNALFITLAHPRTTNLAKLEEYRPVAFDGQGNRHVLQRLFGGETSRVAMYRYRLDPKKLPVGKVKRIGVEMLIPQVS